MQKSEYHEALLEIVTQRIQIQSQFLKDSLSGDIPSLKRKLKEDLFILKVKEETLKTNLTLGRLQKTQIANNTQSNTISNFITECIETKANSSESKKDVYEEYCLYCARNEITPILKNQTFCKEFIHHFPNGEVEAARVPKLVNCRSIRVYSFKGITFKQF